MKHTPLLLLLALPAFAAQPSKTPPPKPSVASAAGSATVITPLKIQATAELSFGSVGGSTALQGGYVVIASRSGGQVRTSTNITLNKNGGETPLIRTLTGQPGQSYRITVPASVTTMNNLTVNTFTLYSGNNKDVTATKLAALDSKGSDTLRVGATLFMPFGTPAGTYTARVPVTLAYE
jgi:hypothetical protein